MAIYSRGRLELARQWKERDQVSPERSKVWFEPKSKCSDKRKVPVVYYLSRNGHLEHPHFMEVPLSARDDGLYLKDVINRLSVLRGKGMAGMYSWSSKRIYKNRFVWQDLCEGDLIHPAHGGEYVLKGSELLGIPPPSSAASSSSGSEQAHLEIPLKLKEKSTPSPWSSIHLNEYKVYKSELIADAATQTDDRKQRRRLRGEIQQMSQSCGSVVDREEMEISPPPSSSSPETLESLTKPDGRLIAEDRDRTAVSYCSSGRFRASAVLMQLVTCGSVSVKENVTRGGLDSGRKGTDGLIGESSFGSSRFEDKEYFSGSLIEMKKREEESGGAMLKRSNSYNADRSSKLGLAAAKEIDVARTKCIPRKTNKIATAAAGRRERSVVGVVGSMVNQGEA